MGAQKFRKRMAKLKIVFLSIALCWSLPLQAYDIDELVKILIEKNENVEDSLIIHLDSIENDLLILFIVSRDKFDSDQIKKHIKENRSPRHVPDKIYCCPAIPYTISGKKLEVPIKKILNGENPNNVLSLDSLKNPESIEWFINFRKKELNII